MADSATPTDAVIELLTDSFGRIHALIGDLTEDLTADVATYRPDPQANSIAWLIWHSTRVQDSHLAELTGEEEIWTEKGWYDAFDLPFGADATGYGQSAGDVGSVVATADQLRGYHQDVNAATTRYLRSLTSDALARVVDENWDPPVTLGARLVSVIGDCLQHLGQVAYVRGLAERR